MPAKPWLLLARGVALCLALIGCAETGGERVRFEAQALPTAPLTEIDGRPAIVHTYDSGWTVELTEATVHLGPLYLWSDEPQLQTRFSDWLLPRAFASDQFRAGFLRGEVTEQAAVDLLQAQPTALGTGVALAGPSRSGELWLEPVPSGAPTLTLAGVASSAEEVLPFRAEISYVEPWLEADRGGNTLLLRRLRGLLWEAELAEGGLLTVEVDARAFFEGIDWSEAPAILPDEDEVLLGPEDEVGRVLSARIRQIGNRGAWTLKWNPETR